MAACGLIIRRADRLVRVAVGWRSPVGWQRFGFERVVDPGAVGAGAGSALEEEQHLAHSVTGLAVVDLAPACLLKSTVRLVDGPMDRIAVADTVDAGRALTRPVAANRCGRSARRPHHVVGGLGPHVGEQVGTAG